MAIRSRTYNNSWNSWHKILDTYNYGSYALPLSGGTITGSLIINNTTDADVSSNTSTALTIGASSGPHLKFDNNEIMAKADASTGTSLYLNAGGGIVDVGTGGLRVEGKTTSVHRL